MYFDPFCVSDGGFFIGENWVHAKSWVVYVCFWCDDYFSGCCSLCSLASVEVFAISWVPSSKICPLIAPEVRRGKEMWFCCWKKYPGFPIEFSFVIDFWAKEFHSFMYSTALIVKKYKSVHLPKAILCGAPFLDDSAERPHFATLFRLVSLALGINHIQKC